MKKYAIGGIAIGIIQVTESVITYLYAENVDCIAPWIPFFVIGFLWTIVSLVVAIRVKHQPTRVLALSFFTYKIFEWLSGEFFNSGTDLTEVTIWFAAFNAIFGLIYTLSSAFVAKNP